MVGRRVHLLSRRCASVRRKMTEAKGPGAAPPQVTECQRRVISNRGRRVMSYVCRTPLDPHSARLTGEYLCEFHLEKHLEELMMSP